MKLQSFVLGVNSVRDRFDPGVERVSVCLCGEYNPSGGCDLFDAYRLTGGNSNTNGSDWATEGTKVCLQKVVMGGERHSTSDAIELVAVSNIP